MPLLQTFGNDTVRGYERFGPSGVSLAAYELISSTVVTGSSATSITFSNAGAWNIYKHLQLRIVAKHSNDQNAVMQFNGDTSSNYWWHMVQGNGSSASSFGTSASWMQIGYGPNSSVIPTTSIVDILDFNNVNKTKTVRTLTGCAYSSTLNVKLMSGLYVPTGAITSISMNEISGAYQVGSRFSLYGLRG